MAIKYKRYFKVRAKVVEKRKKVAGKFLKRTVLGLLFFGLIFFIGKKFYRGIICSGAFEVRKIEVTGLETLTRGKFIESLPDNYRNNILLSYFIDFEGPIKRYLPKIKRYFDNKRYPAACYQV